MSVVAVCGFQFSESVGARLRRARASWPAEGASGLVH